MRYIAFIVIVLQIQMVSADIKFKELSGNPDSNTVFTTMSCPGGGYFIAGGMDIQMTGQFPKMPPYILAGDVDTASLATGNLSLYSKQFGDLFSVNAVYFLDKNRGWAAVTKGLSGAGMYKTKNDGGIWVGLKMAGHVRALKFFDEKHAVAVGTKGYAAWTDDSDGKWTIVQTNVDVDLRCMSWIDGQRGFAAGHEVKTGEDGKDEVGKGVVLETKDRGRTWTVLYRTNGVALCPIFFLPDGKTGYLAASKNLGNDQVKPILFKTTDGGKSFTDLNLPLEVGSVSGMGSFPLNFSVIGAMYFDGQGRGILAGSAFITKMNNGKQDKTYYKNAAYMTKDGGKTWWKTDVGTVKINFQNMPPTEGAMVTGCFQDLATGWIAGSNGFVYSVRVTCKEDSDCMAGYTCDNGFCQLSGGKTGSEGGSDTGGYGQPDAAGGTDIALATDGQGTHGGVTDLSTDAKSSGGCSTLNNPVSSIGYIMLTLLLFGMLWHKRHA